MSSPTKSKQEHNTSDRYSTDPIGDLVYAVFDVSVPALPVLSLILVLEPISSTGVKNATFSAWLTVILGVALFYGEWITPPRLADTGWIPLTPSLLGVRVVYYNLLLLVAGYSGGIIGTVLQSIYISAMIGIGLSALGIGLFPWLTHRYWSFYSV